MRIFVAASAAVFAATCASAAPGLRDGDAIDNFTLPAPARPVNEWALPADYASNPETVRWIEEFEAGLSERHGAIEIRAARATLDVPAAYYFLDRKDAKKVLEEAWGNPPDDSVLGMIFPAGAGPFDEGVWAATVSYSPDGYVSDEDAAEIDYDALMLEMQAAARADNTWRERNGYDAVDLLGWAEKPAYDASAHKLYWAQELHFGGFEQNTLNYDIRVLGRHGVLVIGFIADMDQLGAIRRVAPDVLDMARFNEGAGYDDYVPGKDREAAYGIAGLIAGAAVAKKTGLLAALAVFGKKFIGLIIVGAVAAAGGAKRLLGRKTS